MLSKHSLSRGEYSGMRDPRSNRRCLCVRCHIRNDVVSLFLLPERK
nr:MAG TPA: NinG protein [Caudoviricetes sp.]